MCSFPFDCVVPVSSLVTGNILFRVISALFRTPFILYCYTLCLTQPCLTPQKSRRYRPLRNSCPPMTLPLTKSVSMLAISQRDIDGE